MNLVEITVRANDDTASGYTAIKAKAARAGADAGKAFSAAFKLAADSSITTKDRLEATGGIGGADKELLNKLKSFANTPGGIGILGTGNDTSLISMLRRQIQAAGESGGLGLLGGSSQSGQTLQDTIRQQIVGNGPSNVNTTDLIKQVIEGNGPGNYDTSDFIKQVLEGSTPGNVTTEDIIRRVVEGSLPGNMSTTDVIHEKIDDSTIKAQGEKDGKTYGSGFASSLKNALSGFLGGSGGGAGGDIGKLLTGGSGGGGSDAGAISGALNSGGIAGGALPGVAGLSGMQATIIGLGGALVSVLPAITSVLGGLTAIGGGFAILEATNKKFAADVSSVFSGIEKTVGAAAAPLVKPLEGALSQLAGFIKQIEPDLKAVFADSAPLLQPLIKGFEELMSGAGPGFLAMIKAAQPVFVSMAGAFANLGKSLGTMFSDFASDGAGSATVLKALLEIVNSLLPFIGKLGEIMVSALAPAFAAFSAALAKVLPALTPLLSVLGDLAGATLGDLASVLGAVGSLLVDLAPSFKLLASVAANLFNTLENTGVFAILGDALENLAGPIANLINALVHGIAPALPQIISLVSQFSGVLVTLMSDGLGVLIDALAKVVQLLAPVLPAIVDVVAAVKAWTVAQAALNLILDMNPFIAITAAVVLVAGIIIKYHTQIWNVIVKTWDDVSGFIASVWNNILQFAQQWWPLLLGVGGVIYKYHEDIWQFIQNIWGDVLGFLKGIWNDIYNALSSSSRDVENLLAGVWNDVYGTVRSAWDNIVGWFKGIPHDLVAALSGLGDDLNGFAANAMSLFLSGAKRVMGDIEGFFKNIPKDILGWLGIHSPPDWAISAGEEIVNGITGGINKAKSRVASATKAVAAAAGSAAAGHGGAGAPGAGSAGGSNEQVMKNLAAAMGWTGAQWNALYSVEMAEAGFNLTATNPGSGAYGMAQFIQGPSEYYAYGGNPNTASGQAIAMLNYIQQRYGNPANAWAHESAYHWYGAGGAAPSGWAVVGDQGRELVKLPGGSTVMPNGATEAALAGGGGLHITLELGPSFKQAGLTDAQLKDIRYTVRTKGHGDVQAAFGGG